MAEFIGGLIPTFLLSRLVLWLLRKWEGGLPRLVTGNVASWIVCSGLAGFFMAYGQVFSFAPAKIYAISQLTWLVMDFVLWNRKTQAESEH